MTVPPTSLSPQRHPHANPMSLRGWRRGSHVTPQAGQLSNGVLGFPVTLSCRGCEARRLKPFRTTVHLFR